VIDEQTYNDIISDPNQIPSNPYGDPYANIDIPIDGNIDIVNGTCCKTSWCGYCPDAFMPDSFTMYFTGRGSYSSSGFTTDVEVIMLPIGLDYEPPTTGIRADGTTGSCKPVIRLPDDEYRRTTSFHSAVINEQLMALYDQTSRNIEGCDIGNAFSADTFLTKVATETNSCKGLETRFEYLTGGQYDDRTFGSPRWERTMPYTAHPFPEEFLEDLPINYTKEDVGLCEETSVCPGTRQQICALFPTEPGCNNSSGGGTPPATTNPPPPMVCQNSCPPGSGARQTAWPYCMCVCPDNSLLGSRRLCSSNNPGSGSNPGSGNPGGGNNPGAGAPVFNQTNTINGAGNSGNSGGGGGGGNLQQLMKGLF
jgi:hypothetical protein